MTDRPARRGLAGVAVLAAALGPAACGAGRSGLTAVEQNQLLGLIAQARSSAAAGDPAAAQSALTQLRATVSQLRVAGVLDPARAARMQSVAAQALNTARAQPAPPPAAPRSTTSTPPGAAIKPAPVHAPAAPAQVILQTAPTGSAGQALANGKGKGHGKDKGGGGGGGD